MTFGRSNGFWKVFANKVGCKPYSRSKLACFDDFGQNRRGWVKYSLVYILNQFR